MCGGVSSGVSEKDRELIVTQHNTLRSSVSPPASDMMRLRWDTELALVAEGWAETCNTYSDPPARRTVPGTWGELGQNMAVNGSSWSDVIHSWWQGKNDLDKVNGSYEQYVQVVWASTVRVGCGFADCGAFHVHVCNYAPSMNVREMTSPYRPGSSCQHCPHTCRDNLCDCGDQRCENLATLDPATCTCQCLQPFHRQPTCSLSCSDVEEASFCKHSSLVTCSRVHNMAVYCPWLCNVCPFGGHDYNSSSNNTNDNNNKVKTGSTSGSSRCCLGYGGLLVTCFWGVVFVTFRTI
ncbi:hypothetical protein V1264_002565 [Littorina saxatilis]|uniref:SCP domain-containing protein n=1 Tax=Littorina saxatilis TaxID=31220 RepID=A0AAN9G7K6_9CAEN